MREPHVDAQRVEHELREDAHARDLAQVGVGEDPHLRSLSDPFSHSGPQLRVEHLSQPIDRQSDYLGHFL